MNRDQSMSKAVIVVIISMGIGEELTEQEYL